MNCHAYARHARSVGHRQVIAGLERNLAVDSNLAAEVHQESAVRDMDDFRHVHLSQFLNDFVAMLLVTNIDRDVADDVTLSDSGNINGAYISAEVADSRRDSSECAWDIADLQAQSQAVACTWFCECLHVRFQCFHYGFLW